MLKEITKSVMNAVAGVSANEFRLLSSGALTIDKNGSDNKPCSISIKACGFSIRKPNVKDGTILLVVGNLVNYMKRFRVSSISQARQKLIGMELKHGCQYNREWVDDIWIDEDKLQIMIKSSSGEFYNADNIRVYSTEENLCSIYDFAIQLLISDGAVIGGVKDG